LTINNNNGILFGQNLELVIIFMLLWNKLTSFQSILFSDVLLYGMQFKGQVQCFSMQVVMNKYFS